MQTNKLPLVWLINSHHLTDTIDNGAASSIVETLLMIGSIILIIITFPISIWSCIQVVQEYERVVIFRLGRLMAGGARGPGIFFVIPCIDTYQVVDLRTVSFDVPPQEVSRQTKY